MRSLVCRLEAPLRTAMTMMALALMASVPAFAWASDDDRPAAPLPPMPEEVAFSTPSISDIAEPVATTQISTSVPAEAAPIAKGSAEHACDVPDRMYGASACCAEPVYSGCCPRPACGGVEIGGWASGGIYSNAWGASNNALPMRQQAGGSFDQLWLYAEKKINNGGYGLDWGGRVDFVFGADAKYARVGPAHSTLPMLADASDNGWDHDWDTSSDGEYGVALPQLYGELAINRLTLRAGHFFSLIGYERIPVVENFFYSRSYAFGVEPITHMGALASYELVDGLEITGGVTNGWDNGWLNPSGATTGLGKVSARLTDRMSLHYAVTFGNLQPGNQVYLHSIVLEWQMTDRWEYVLQSDFAVDTGGAADVRQDYGMNQYLFYKLNERLKIGTRVEWLRAESHNTRAFGTDVFETRTGVTLGLNYSPCRNITIRPEVRYDAASGRLSNDFNDRRDSDQFAGGVDVIFRM